MTNSENGLGTQGVEWGPEIAVAGKRPWWLADGVKFQWTDRSRPDFTWWSDIGFTQTTSGRDGFNNDMWDTLVSIRLPANHPHYANQALNSVKAELGKKLYGTTAHDQLERMEDITRKLAARANGDGTVSLFNLRADVEEAAEVVALLPEPVDPDLVEARDIIRSHPLYDEYEPYQHHHVEEMIATALKRGRELAGEGK